VKVHSALSLSVAGLLLVLCWFYVDCLGPVMCLLQSELKWWATFFYL